MTEQTSRLAIIIDSTGAEKNTENLTTALHGLTEWGQKAAASAGKVKKATEEEAGALSNLLDRIDPVNAALNKLDTQQKELAKFKAKGFIDTDTFDAYSKKIEDSRGRLTGFSDQLSKTGMSAKQTAAAMRMVPAQMTDIIVSLQGGQAPLTVLLQQGGQLKDMFGGIGPAAKALGGYVAGLINQFTLAAAAAGVLGLAYYKGSQEQSAFNESLILTGNLVSKTSGQLLLIASNISAATNTTTGNASAVLNQLVSAGKVAGDSLQTVASAIVNINKETGIATDQLVSDFGKLAKDPVAAIAELNEKYNFLTVATYSQIKALQEEGNTQEAARIATETYANTLNTRAAQIHTSLGTLETAWNAITGAAKGAWDAMLDVGRQKTPEQSLKELSDRIAEAQKAQSEGGIWNSFNSKFINLDAMIKARDELQSQITTNSTLNGIIDERNKKEQAMLKTQQEADKVNQQYISNAERRSKAIEQQKKFLDAGAISAEQYAKNISRINEMYKDAKAPKYSEDAATRLLDQIGRQNQSLAQQLQTTNKLSSATQERIKFEQQIADLKSKAQLTADQKSTLARSDEILQAYKQQEALQNSVKTLDDYRKMQDDVRSKDQKVNDLLKERLALLEKAKATGALQPGEYEKTRANIIQSTKPQLPESVQKIFGANDIGSPASLNNSFISSSSSSLSGYQDDRALSQIEQLKKAMTDYSTFYQQQQDAITQNALLSTQERNDMLVALEQDKNERMKAMNGALYNLQTQTALNSFSSITDSMGTMFGEQSAAYKAAFVTQKAFAIAQAALQLPMAMGQALAGLPFPANLAAMAQVIGLMASITSSISSAAAVGFKTGGYTGNAGVNSVAGVVHGKEYVFDAAATKRIGVSNLDALRNGGSLDATLSRPGYGTGATSVSNSNQNSTTNHNSFSFQQSFTGKPDDATLLAINASNQRMAKQLEDKLTAEIIKPQGKFGNALMGNYPRGRRT